MALEDFAAFILTHGRPDNVLTYKTLREHGYTGPIYIVIDNEDKTADRYRELYGEQVIVFDKQRIASLFDEGDNFHDRRAVFYARNACPEIAVALGVKYFIQLDDDYHYWRYRFTADLNYCFWKINSLDRVFELMLEYYKSIPALTIALAQGGDFIGGQAGTAASKLWMKRKAMNTFICSTERPFSFIGRVNEDVNTYVTLGHRGELFFTIFNASVGQQPTQQNHGGMSEMYLDSGTYVKSFYTVMYAPSCTTIQEIGYLYRRIHHRIHWERAVPCIVSEALRKPSPAQPSAA